MIELTDEIQRAYAEAWFRTIGMDEEDVQRSVAIELRDPMPWRIAALQAVLALVERDNVVRPLRCPNLGTRFQCMRQAGHDGEHGGSLGTVRVTWS